jgi:hypothetical protein
MFLSKMWFDFKNASIKQRWDPSTPAGVDLANKYKGAPGGEWYQRELEYVRRFLQKRHRPEQV